MILQTNPGLNEKVQEFGCAFMDILWFCVLEGALTINNLKDIEKLYNEAVRLNAMNKNCFILNWNETFRVGGLDVVYTDRHEPPDRMCEPDEIEILRFPGHFVAGNGQSVVTYDSYGRSRAVETGNLKNKRIFLVRGLV